MQQQGETMATESDAVVQAEPQEIIYRQPRESQINYRESLLHSLRDSQQFYSNRFTSMVEIELMQSLRTDGTSWIGGSFIMANVCIGMGLLHFPKAVEDAGGILHSFILLGVFLAFIVGSLAIIAHCCKYYGCVSYQDMVTVHCGHKMGVLCQIFLFVETLGSCMVKLVVFGDQIVIIRKALLKKESVEWYLNKRFLLTVIATICILPLCLLKNFQLFKYVSPVGIFAAFYVTCLTIIKYYTLGNSASPVEDPDRIINIITLFPLLVYAFHGHVEAPVVWCCLRRQRIAYFMRLTLFYLFIATLFYSVTAIFGVLTFGSSVEDDILLAYRSGDPMATVGVVLIVLKLFSSFPIIFYITRSVFDQFWRRFLITRLPRMIEEDNRRRIIQTFILFFTCIAFAVSVEDMKKAIDLIGSVSCNFAFTFPGMCLMMLHLNKQEKNTLDKLLIGTGICYMLFGVYLMGMNGTIAIKNFYRKTHN